ncbi:MAG TPA: glycerol acyltransferase [Candidatus Marinimicrobia bacterium]|nr:glycerol acyltransferase [Candidatus Neomarinimicrobiota bacterium]
MTSVPKVIDVELALQEKIPDIYKKIPGVLIRLMEKVIRQDDMNRMIHESSHLNGIPLVDWVLDQFGVNIVVKGKKLIPKKGRYIYPANHPIGGLDGLAIVSVVAKIHPLIKFVANDLLRVIKGFDSISLYIARFGQINRRNAILINKTLASEAQLLVQPAGTVSKRNPVKIRDLAWNKFFIHKAIQYKRDVIPIHVQARNSRLFYNIASFRKIFRIKSNMEMFLLPREMFNKSGKTITITFGIPIAYKTFDDSRTHLEWAQKVREYVYVLGSEKFSSANTIPAFSEVL